MSDWVTKQTAGKSVWGMKRHKNGRRNKIKRAGKSKEAFRSY